MFSFTNKNRAVDSVSRLSFIYAAAAAVTVVIIAKTVAFVGIGTVATSVAASIDKHAAVVNSFEGKSGY